jgi:Family of unknown function (DUF6878)
MTHSDKPSGDATPPDAGTPTTSPSLAQYYRERLDNARRGLPEAARRLKAAGVELVHIRYDGCGDSGQIEEVTYTDAQGKSVNPADQMTLTEDQLMELFYDLTQARHPGWENDDGAFGEFEWNLTADTLHHSHNDRFTEYYTTEYDGL